MKDLVTRYQIPATKAFWRIRILRQRENKTRVAFPWKKLYDEYGIGMWYDDAAKQAFLTQIIPKILQLKFNESSFCDESSN